MTRSERCEKMQTEVPLQVAVRVRPLINKEAHLDPCLYCIPNQPQLVIGKDKQFSFDYVFPEQTSQTSVYEECVKPLIDTFFEGYNVTVFAYGQTGSGKTYTMGIGNCVLLDEEECGIVPRAITDIFTKIDEISGKTLCKMKVSFIEVYKEETSDLLAANSKSLKICEDDSGNTVIVGVTEEPVKNAEDVLSILDGGTSMRHIGVTSMNDVSSRSHCIFTLLLDQYICSEDYAESKGTVLSSRFHFVDLAGSERAHRTGNQGERFKESVYINTGLLALGNVISALSDPKRNHVAYRESKLTRLLKDSLGGNSRTVMITCLSPALADLDENINSLKFATRVKNIKNKPVINCNFEDVKINHMETEIMVLRDQLQRRLSDQTEVNGADQQRMALLEIKNEKHELDQNTYLQSLHEVNILLQCVEAKCIIPPEILGDIEDWRENWDQTKTVRPMTAPPKSILTRPQNDMLENLRTEVSKYKELILVDNKLLQGKNNDNDELRNEIIAFGEENATLRLQLDVANNRNNDLQERIYEQQMVLQELRVDPVTRQLVIDKEEKSPAPAKQFLPMTPHDRVMQSFRAKSELIISQMNDLDEAEHDEDISTDDEDEENEIEIAHWCQKEWSEPSMSRGRRYVSHIPKHSKLENFTSRLPVRQFLKPVMVDDNNLAKLESSRDIAQHAAKTADCNVREVSCRMKILEHNIKQKEGLISDLVQSELESRTTSLMYKEKLAKLEKEYVKSKHELEEAQQKINEKSKDAMQKSKLESDIKRKQKSAQRKLDTLKQKEAISKRISSYQENNERKIKDLEACISRMKNQHIELERKVKSEEEKKAKFESELYKNELRIHELETKTDKQQKLLKRKNEEVVVAQRKLRTGIGVTGSSKTSDPIEKKKQWIENEIEKIIARQKDIDILEEELRERDESLKKKEALLHEKSQLEVKKMKSSQNLSQNIMRLSIQMENVDQQLQHLGLTRQNNKDVINKDSKKLLQVKSELIAQKTHLEDVIETGLLHPQEERRLIELGEAVDAVNEAIQFKNDLITQKQTCLNEDESIHYKNVEHLLNDMGELSVEEYKHLLGKLFLKIIELRKSNNQSDDARYHFEIKISAQEKQILDLQHTLQVVESRWERQFVEENIEYGKEINFLMGQLRLTENEVLANENNIKQMENKIKLMEKDLYFYKTKTRKYKDQLRDFTNDVSTDQEESTVEHRESSASSKCSSGDEFHLPPVNQHALIIEKKEKFDRRYQLDHQAIEDAKRLQDIFKSKPPSSPVTNRSYKRKESNPKKKYAEEQSFADSIEMKKSWNQYESEHF